MPRRMAYCPSPLLLRSIVTPDIRWITLATVISGDSSMALALMTLTTFMACFSMPRAPASVLPGLWAITVTSFSTCVSESRLNKMSSLEEALTTFSLVL